MGGLLQPALHIFNLKTSQERGSMGGGGVSPSNHFKSNFSNKILASCYCTAFVVMHQVQIWWLFLPQAGSLMCPSQLCMHHLMNKNFSKIRFYISYFFVCLMKTLLIPSTTSGLYRRFKYHTINLKMCLVPNRSEFAITMEYQMKELGISEQNLA